jgi:aryl-alcohol dehydrogenase-like predicted oxidoreductase
VHIRSLSCCQSSGLALAPWDVLASGRFRTDAEDKARQESGEKGRVSFTQDGKGERNEDECKMSAALEKVAAEVGAKSIQAGTYLPLFALAFLKFIMNIH